MTRHAWIAAVLSGAAAGMVLMLATPAGAQDLSKIPGKDSDPTLNMRLNYTRPEIREAQIALQAHGFDPRTTDGIFWPWTRAALIACQKAHGLEVTGRFDPETMAHLRGPRP